MPTDTARKRLTRWNERITAADKVYLDWSNKFRVNRLAEYIEGFQWGTLTQQQMDSQQPYTVNMIAATLEIMMASLLFDRPQVRVEPRKARADDPQTHVQERAQLSQDTVQTFIDDEQVGFYDHTSLALLDAAVGPGIIEVGYTANWVDNPHAGKPVLKENSNDPMVDRDNKEVMQPERIRQSERCFLKRVPFEDFRVSHSNRNVLDENDWIGYREWHYVEDIKRNPTYKNTSKLKATGKLREMPTTTDDDTAKHRDMVLIWKIWDLRAKKKHVLADGHMEGFLIEDQPFVEHPFAVLKFKERRNTFYPKPPVHDWIGPQDEINEIRESQKVHRRRFYRRYMRAPSVKETEWDKLEQGGDGVCIEVPEPNPSPIQPIPDAPLSSAVDRDLAYAFNDLLQVSGVSGEQRGVQEAETATQANIIEGNAQLRESKARKLVAKWLARIARLMFLTIRSEMTLPFWIERNADPLAPPSPEAARIAKTWQELTADALTDADLDFIIDIGSLSPVTQQMERADWAQVIALISNPAVALLLSQSELLLKKTLGMYGVKSTNELNEIKKAIANTVSQMMLLAAANGEAPPGLSPQPARSGRAAGVPAIGGVQ